MKNEIQLLNFLNEVDVKLGVNAKGDLVVRGGKEKLTPELLTSIKQFKRQLVTLLSDEQAVTTTPTITPVERQLKEPLSYAQKRLWLDEQIGEKNSRYNIPAALELRGILDYQALDKAFDQIVARHAVLRSVIAEDEKGNPYQTIMPAAPFKCDCADLSDVDGAEVETRLSQLVLAESMQEFDLSADLMLRAKLIKCTEQRHVLCLTMHHIVSDGWSMSVLVNEFKAFYCAELTKAQGDEQQPKAVLPEPQVQYVDYAVWQEKLHESESFKQQLQYWVNALEDAPPLHSLPVDHNRPAVQSFRGGHVQTVVQTELLSRLQKLCREQDVTLFMALHAAFSVLISRYSYSRDIVMGTSVANREQPQLEGLIGFFVNTLVLRLDLQHEPSFTELMAQSKQVLLGAYERQQVPFEKVVEAINPERRLSHPPLFQIMLSMQNNEASELSLPDLSIDSFPIESKTAKYDLSLDISETSDALLLNWEYSSDLFLSDSIAGLAENFTFLLERVDLCSYFNRNALAATSS